MPFRDIARRWILANFFAMLVIGAANLCGYLARKALAADGTDSTLSTVAIYVAIETVLGAASLVGYAQLSAKVIRLIVPALSQRGWVSVHLSIGLAGGLAGGLISSEPTNSEPIDWSDTGFVVFLIMILAVAGALLGAVLGSLQALVLRRAAEGTLAWIAISAAVTSVMLLIVIAAVLLLPSEQTLASEVASNGVIVAAGVAGAIGMLPALRRLRPRTP